MLFLNSSSYLGIVLLIQFSPFLFTFIIVIFEIYVYFGSICPERYYDVGETIFDKDMHIKLRDMLKDIQGKCSISYNDDDFIRELYKDFNIEEVQGYSNLTQKQNQNPYCELIINY